MLDLSAPALNQLKGEDAKNLVAFYMNTQGLTKTHEFSVDATAEINVAPAQPNILKTSVPSGPGAGSSPRRTPQTVQEGETTNEQ